MPTVEHPPTLSPAAFSAAARALAAAAPAEGLTPAAFRSPPRLEGVRRTVRRLAPDTVLVAVERRGRPAPDVIADMVDGTLRANGHPIGSESEVRARLIRAASAATCDAHPLHGAA